MTDEENNNMVCLPFLYYNVKNPLDSQPARGKAHKPLHLLAFKREK